MIINDPVHGFIEIPKGLLTTLVKHPAFVRLSRIEQLGPTSYVYPGGCHSRFSHSIGTLHLITEALRILERKGCVITSEEAEAAKAAMLLHDLGHGPMSHSLEGNFVYGLSHEDMTLLLMQQLNVELDGRLSLAITIFRDEYPKHFLHELICSQLDMDRLDYLCRDSFFAGVREGNIGAERIIKMLNVKDDRLVVEQKGIYTIENYLMARRLMYWQVYLHRTAVGYEKVLINTLRRAKELVRQGFDLYAPPSLAYFLKNNIDAEWFASHEEALQMYAELDDSDIWSALKAWKHADDRILSLLATDMLDRRLFHVEVREEPPTKEETDSIRCQIATHFNIGEEEAEYLMYVAEIGKDMYNPADDSIGILYKDGTVKDISEASEILNVQLLSKKIRKYYLCYQRI